MFWNADENLVTFSSELYFMQASGFSMSSDCNPLIIFSNASFCVLMLAQTNRLQSQV